MKVNPDWSVYLRSTDVIDSDHPSIQSLVEAQGWRDQDEIIRTRSAFEYVRDHIRHSWDAQDSRVTCVASEVLQHGAGLCYAKSHLLAAILRALGIPTGICYQRLVLFEDPSDGYSLHALNASYLASHGRWVRFDARGNRAGIDAQFSLGEERLAFSPRSELDECDYPEIFGDPAEIVLLCLTRHRDSQALYASGLPSAL